MWEYMEFAVLTTNESEIDRIYAMADRLNCSRVIERIMNGVSVIRLYS